MSNFLPSDYKIQDTSGNYMRFQPGLNQIRILGSAVVGWEYFNQDNKPVRSREPFEEYPSDIKRDGKVKQFWAFPVWNYQQKRVQVLELTQKTIMVGVKSLVDNPKWGDPTMYDIAITKVGDGMDTEYSVQGEPPIGKAEASILALYRAKPINLEALFDGKDPFEAPAGRSDIEITAEDIPA